MKSWMDLNLGGRLLYVGCLVNMFCAISLAFDGSYFAIFSVTMAMFCGLSTHLKKYQKYTFEQNESERRQ